jgi:hypothetical protein
MWVASLENRLMNSKDDIVITDCRFPNEIKALKNIGAKVLRVKRGPEPEWYEHAKNYNAGKKRIGWAIGKHHLDEANVHASEYSWVGSKFDKIITNDSTIEDLYEQVEELLKIGDQVALTPA